MEVTLTPEEIEEFRQMKAKKIEAERAKEQREEYLALVDEQIEASLEELVSLSERINEVKTKVMDNFKAVLELKREVIKTRDYDSLQSHTFTNSTSTKRITIGVYMLDGYADTVEDGIQKVKDYITSLAKDEDSKMLVSAVMKLLSKNQQGILKASRVMQLRNMAEVSGNDDFIEGVRIIEEAYRPTPSKSYIRADVKGEHGEWIPVSLGMTEGKMIEKKNDQNDQSI